MDTFFQAVIMAFREGVEGFLIIVILLKFLDKTGNKHLKTQVWLGSAAGIFISVVFGFILMEISSYIGGLKTTAKLWEALGGFIAVILVSTFIIWMIKYGSKLKQHIENEASKALTRNGVLFLILFMVAREGTEIAIFSFAGEYSISSIFMGLILALIFVLLINYALIEANLNFMFTVTLFYLIIQAGYLLGYSIHEGLSAAKSLSWINENHFLFNKAFNLSDTIFNHKEGLLGIPLNVVLGWYSKPEWIQLIIQYTFIILLSGYWFRVNENQLSILKNK